MANKPVDMNDLRQAIAKLEFKPTISNESLMSIQSTDSTTDPLEDAKKISSNKRKRPMSSSELRDSIPLSDSSDDDDIKAELKRITPKKRRKVTVRKGGKRRKRTRKKRRKKKTRKKRGGVERWRRVNRPPIPPTFDDIGYFYDCKPIVVPNKSKYREHMIITGDRDANELMQPHKLKIARMEDSEFYDPQLILVDMALPEGERGMRWFRRRAQELCNRGYKPLKRNDAKTGAGRKKKTRKKKKTKRRR